MNRSESLILNAEDLNFCLYDWLDVESLTRFDRYASHGRETFDDILDLSRQLAEVYFEPHNRVVDLDEPQLVDGKVSVHESVGPSLDALAGAGLLAATMSDEDGGFDLPHVVYRAAFMWLQAANIGSASYALLTTAAVHLIREHASPALVARYVPPMIDGRWFGTMNLSEPDVGSALGDLTTAATRQADGTYRVRGDKMWISGGDHEIAENIVHLVLARTGGAGVKGLSLLLVPKWLGEAGSLDSRNDVAIVGVNHKMGYRGTVNTALSYGSGAHPVAGSAGAIGYLIGEEGRGLEYMFLMMNEARLGVGASAAALAMSGFLHANSYARSRRQGRALGAKDADEAVAIIRHPDVRRMLLSAKAYAEGSIALVLYASRLLDESQTAADAERRQDAALLLNILTPLAKSWPSQWGLAANDLAIQVHGGAGYTRDFPVEQFYRDNRLNAIHEGTHGIQGIDLLGRKVRLADGAGFRALLERMRSTSAAAADVAPALAEQLDRRIDRLDDVTTLLWASGDPVDALANSSAYLEASGDLAVAWMLLDQVRALGDRDDAFAQAKRATTSFFFSHLLPRADVQLNLLASQDRTLVEINDDLI